MARTALIVYLDRDPTPGEMHTPESVRNVVDRVLRDRLGQYNPIVHMHDEGR